MFDFSQLIPIIFIVLFILVAVALCFGLLLWRISVALIASTARNTAQTERVGTQFVTLIRKVDDASTYFAPIRKIPCNSCAGSGYRELENPLWKFAVDALRQASEKKKKAKK